MGPPSVAFLSPCADFPSSTATYFSWTIASGPVAALIGGLYLASAGVFAWAYRRPDVELVSLTAGVLGLAVPTLILTVIHRDVFDWIRWQAVEWAVLFLVTPVTIGLELRRLARAGSEAGGTGPVGTTSDHRALDPAPRSARLRTDAPWDPSGRKRKSTR